MTASTFSSQISPRYTAGDALLFVIVLGVALTFAASMLVNYASDPGELWHGLRHDRNVHFGEALKLAVALQSFNLPRALALLIEPHFWPPLADLSLALVMNFGGFDVKLAILPSSHRVGMYDRTHFPDRSPSILRTMDWKCRRCACCHVCVGKSRLQADRSRRYA